MTRPYHERRNRQVMILVERRKLPQKTVARMLGISYANVRWILHCMRTLTKSNTIIVASNSKKA